MSIPVTYLRSSSVGTFKFCEHQYFLTYVLGKPMKTNFKAEMGTVSHWVFESLAIIKKHFQTSSKTYRYKIDEMGVDIKVKKDDLLCERKLTPLEIDKINTSRINKDIYKWNCFLEYDHVRHGVDLVEYLCTKGTDYYKSHSPNKWAPIATKHINNFVWLGLDFADNMFDPRRRNIVDVETRFDIEIPNDWAKYEYFIGDEHIEGQLSLKGTMDLTTQVSDDTYEIIDWKGLPINTKIPTVNGWKTMGELKPGDKIFDKDGQVTMVKNKSSKNFKDCYEIEFDDKTKVTCDDEHLWLLSNGKVVDAPNLQVRNKIDVAKPMNLDEVDLPIDPYVFGMWLGDGRNRSGEISSGDDFIFSEIEKRGYTLSVDQEKRLDTLRTHVILGLTQKLRKLTVLNNKHIPYMYLRGSYHQRLELLRGLMDSDGNANTTRKQVVFTTTDKQLSDDVKELLLSLGQRVNQSEINRSTNFSDNVDIYPLAFRPININPFLIPRKANKIDPNWGCGRSDKRIITKITRLNVQQETQCVEVDSPSNTYLCTENMIPTHNTGQKLDWATGKPKTYDSLHDDHQLLLYYYVAKQLYPDKNILMSIFFIRDGGPYTLCFDEEKLEQGLELFKKTFEDLKNTKIPRLLHPKNNDFRCYRICDYFKQKVDGTNMCQLMHKEIKDKGIDQVIKDHTEENFSIHSYSAPGSV